MKLTDIIKAGILGSALIFNPLTVFSNDHITRIEKEFRTLAYRGGNFVRGTLKLEEYKLPKNITWNFGRDKITLHENSTGPYHRGSRLRIQYGPDNSPYTKTKGDKRSLDNLGHLFMGNNLTPTVQGYLNRHLYVYESNNVDSLSIKTGQVSLENLTFIIGNDLIHNIVENFDYSSISIKVYGANTACTLDQVRNRELKATSLTPIMENELIPAEFTGTLKNTSIEYKDNIYFKLLLPK